jgi:hypothetical protein
LSSENKIAKRLLTMEGEKEDPLVLNVDKNNARAAAVARQAGIGKKRRKKRREREREIPDGWNNGWVSSHR